MSTASRQPRRSRTIESRERFVTYLSPSMADQVRSRAGEWNLSESGTIARIVAEYERQVKEGAIELKRNTHRGHP